MPGFESDLDSSLRQESDGRKADGSGATTPHRAKRINLGTPANYYFKYMNSGKKNMDISFGKDEGDTGMLSIPGYKIDGTPSKGETSFFSIAGSSTASEASDDLLNKSTLSDTTELTASNFVLVTTSKQNMIRKKQNSLSRPDNKENALNRKEHELQNKPQTLEESRSALEKYQGEKSSLKAKSDYGLKNNDIEQVHVARSKASVSGASPSLRSRISSSPASLRKFHENLKNSRMKRQIQREEDTKRRLSIEGTDTLDSINAQLEALTGDGAFHRERLPPQFSKVTGPKKLGSDDNSHQSSPAGSAADETATIEMTDLDDLLGIKDSAMPGSPSDSTTDRSSSEDERKRENSDAKDNQQKGSGRKSPFVSEGTRPGFASPMSTSKSNSRKKKMTPTKLSSTPRRIVNPDSLFSPARNTRSATKKRKLAEQERDESPTEQIVRSSKQSSKGRTRLFQVELQPGNDTSVDSESSKMLIDSLDDKNNGEIGSPGHDDTASLGDMANLFGIGKSVDESFESSIIDSSEKKERELDGQETASIGDINAILNGAASSDHKSPDQKTSHTSRIPNEEPSGMSQSFGASPDSIGSENEEGTKDIPTSKSSSREIFDASSSEGDENLADMEDSASVTTKEDSTSALDSVPRQKCPSPSRTPSQQNFILESLDGGETHGRNIPKSPIRLTPNRHRKPTPTKLTPIPRRVMNPQNPNSPARNTRSSKKSPLDKNSKVEQDDVGGVRRESLSTSDENSKVEVGKVLFSSNRRQSLGVRRPVNVMKGSQSPTQKPPVGILSSKKKNFPRRSVAFGSPEAAEYNIGSPSMSLTPMPKGRAKALYTVPGFSNLPRDDEAPTGQQKELANNDASIGHGMNLLVDKITVEEMNGSPELSPIMKNKADSDGYQMSLEFSAPKEIAREHERFGALDGVRNASVTGSPSEMRDSSVELTDSESIASMNSKSKKYTSDFVVPLHAQRLNFSAASDISETNDSKVDDENLKKAETTVELEGNMLSLLEATNNGKEGRKENDMTYDMDISMDSSSAVLLNDSNVDSEQFTGNFTNILRKTGIQGDNTVELEGNMLSLLQATNAGTNEKSSNTADQAENTDVSEHFTADISTIITKSGIQGDKTVELEGNMLSLLKATDGDIDEKEYDDKTDPNEASERRADDINCNISKPSNAGDKTIELEGNMLSLLEASYGNKDEGDDGTNDKMDISEDSSSSAVQEPEEFKGNVKKGTEGDNTVELEGDMFSFLEATSGDKNEKASDSTDDVEVIRDSSSLAPKDDIMESGIFTGNLSNIVAKTDKTVELEGNILSLLEATYADKNGEGSSSINKLDITGDLPTLADEVNATNPEQFTGNLGIAEVSVVHSRRKSSGELLSSSLTESDCETSKRNNVSILQASEDIPVSLAMSKKLIVHEDTFSEDAVGTRKRRKSLSSNSFVVDRVEEVQSLVDDITSEHKSMAYDKSVSFSDTAEFITTLSADPGPSTLDVSAFTSVLLEGLKFGEKESDILSNSFSRFSKADNSIDRIVFERWGLFVEAVCGEVERRIDLEGTAVSSLVEIVDDDPKFYTMLHGRFKSTEHGEKIKESMDSLVQAGRKLIEYDWNSWLATVLESFHGPLTDTQQIYANDGTKLEEALRYIQKFQTDLSLMNDMETKLAREKSIRRQKEAAAELEKEIEFIQSELSATKSALMKLEEEETNLLASSKDLLESIDCAKLYDDLRVMAESSQKNFVSLNGLHSWSMSTRTSENRLEFVNTSSCQQTHLKLIYGGAESGHAENILSSRVNSSLSKSKSLYVYHEPLSGFLDTGMKRLTEMSQQNSGNEPVRISEHLQKYTWLTGRLDLVAKEFQVVQRRYNGILHRKSGDLFSFLVEFESERSTVVANFRIESAYYPSFPIEVRLDLMSGDQDLESIKRALVKNANPGFGSLSRACDIIQSIVKGKTN